jgi:hypothetical protein
MRLALLILLVISGCDLITEPVGVTRPEVVSECEGGACLPEEDDYPSPPITPSVPSVHFIFDWGWGGREELTISGDGRLIRIPQNRRVPLLSVRLSGERHDSILAALAPIRTLKRSYWLLNCADSNAYTLEFRDSAREDRLMRRVRTNCGFWALDSDTTGEFSKVVEAVTLLRKLGAEVDRGGASIAPKPSG